MQSPMGAREVKAEFVSNGSELGGSFSGAAGSTPLSGAIEGDKVNWSVTVPSPMGEMVLKFDGALSGDALSGTVAFGAFGSGPFTGARA